MISVIQRLQQLKAIDKANSSQKMIFLVNPKDTRILQAIVAWKTMKLKLDKDLMVQQDCDIEQIWNSVDVNIKQYAITLGCTIQQAIPRLKQLKNLSLIYPDGSINQNARLLVSMYIRNKIQKVRGESNNDN